MKKNGIIKMSFEQVASFLGLDRFHNIEAIHVEVKDFEVRCVRFLVSGPTCPEVVEGATVPWVKPANGGVEEL